MNPIGSTSSTPEERVRWHDLECGDDRDLALWLELAAATPGGPVLDIGCGTGRVSLPLARAGHAVTAVDVDPELLAALERRADMLPVETVCRDACELNLLPRRFALCVAALQTIQLLGGPRDRARFFRAVRRHLQPGGVLACAIVSELESYDQADGDMTPGADHIRLEGRLYVSHATAMRVRSDSIEVERRRLVIGKDGVDELPASTTFTVQRLARIPAPQLEHEGRAAGLTPLPRRVIPAADGLLASEVVVLGA
jgi:SAM-dependent methyltransferase